MTTEQHDALVRSYVVLLHGLSGDVIKTLLVSIIEAVIDDVKNLQKGKKA